MHAHPCPAVISVQAPGRVVVWGTREWFAGEAGNGVPKLPLLTWLTPINRCSSSRFALFVCYVCGLTLPLSLNRRQCDGRVAAAGATLPSTNGAAPR